NVALALVIGGIVGARGLYVIENWSNFKDDLGEIFALNAGGISIYGALIGGAVAGWGYSYFSRVPNLPRAADIAAIGGIIGMAIGRLGDIVNGEHFAKSTDLPWGVVYTDPDSPAYPLRLTAQHPAVGYELIGDLVIFVMLLAIYFRVPRAGVTFFAWVFLYGALRFAVSFLRLDDEVFLGLRTAQIIALIAMPIGLGAVAYLLRTEPADDRSARPRRRRVLREDAPAPEEPTAG
ncbi:MAG: prolipoprotein diacylglyceryl transferase family protein, partial [Dehalococcoidia bacterium]